MYTARQATVGVKRTTRTTAYGAVAKRTPRGKALADHPLVAVGVDFNEASLRATERTLGELGIPHVVVHGDNINAGTSSRGFGGGRGRGS